MESVRIEKWTNDVRDAIRFSSKEDAQAVIGWLWGLENALYIATEHEDIGPYSSPPITVDAEAAAREIAAAQYAYVHHNWDWEAVVIGLSDDAHIAFMKDFPVKASPAPGMIPELEKLIKKWRNTNSPAATSDQAQIHCSYELEKALKASRE